MRLIALVCLLVVVGCNRGECGASDLPPGYKIQVSNKGEYKWVDESGYCQVFGINDRRADAVSAAWAFYNYKNQPVETWQDEKPKWSDESDCTLPEQFEIHTNGCDYRWYDGGLGWSAKCFTTVKAAKADALEYERLKKCGTTDEVNAKLDRGGDGWMKLRKTLPNYHKITCDCE